ncbi:hypothetical protein C8R43DRAFT_557263 [Mycena crocata]|nr:hypothetical protein C8R43DRAFT_557263 [Mycena crocata]
MTTLDNTTTDSGSPSAFAHPPKAPPLTSMPSTPGPEVPGGYPRNSVVFATNKWDHRSGLTAKAPSQPKSQGPAGASYFPPQPSSSSASPSLAARGNNSYTPSPPGFTPYVYPLPTDSSAISTNSNFSTEAHADTDSSRGTLTPTGSGATSNLPRAPNSYAHLTDGHPPTPGSGLRSHFSDDSSLPPTPDLRGSDNGERATSRDSTAPAPTRDLDHPRTQLADRGIEALPSVAPFAAASAFIPTRIVSPETSVPPLTPSTGAIPPSANLTSSPVNSSSSGSSGTRSALSTPSTAPSSPLSASASSPKASPHSPLGNMRNIGSSLSRFASRRGHRKGVSVDSPPPSAFGVRGERASLDSRVPAPAASASPTLPAAHKPSLLRTLRGEAKIISGRIRRDPARVEQGKRMVGGEA